MYVCVHLERYSKRPGGGFNVQGWRGRGWCDHEIHAMPPKERPQRYTGTPEPTATRLLHYVDWSSSGRNVTFLGVFLGVFLGTFFLVVVPGDDVDVAESLAGLVLRFFFVFFLLFVVGTAALSL
jgi:hypothetical protein